MGGLTLAPSSSGAHYVWQRPGLCVQAAGGWAAPRPAAAKASCAPAPSLPGVCPPSLARGIQPRCLLLGNQRGSSWLGQESQSPGGRGGLSRKPHTMTIEHGAGGGVGESLSLLGRPARATAPVLSFLEATRQCLPSLPHPRFPASLRPVLPFFCCRRSSHIWPQPSHPPFPVPPGPLLFGGLRGPPGLHARPGQLSESAGPSHLVPSAEWGANSAF